MTWLGWEAFPLVCVASVLWKCVTPWHWLCGSMTLESGLSAFLSLLSVKKKWGWLALYSPCCSVGLFMSQPHCHLTFAGIIKSWSMLSLGLTRGEAKLSFGDQRREGDVDWTAGKLGGDLGLRLLGFDLLSLDMNEITLWVFVPHVFRDILWQIEWVRCQV